MKAAGVIERSHHLKKMIFAFLFFVIPIIFSTSASAEKNAYFEETVNVRAEPSLTSSVITQVHKGDSAIVLESKTDWTNIQLHTGEEGWVSSRLVSISSDSKERKSIQSTVSDLQVRAGPGKEYKVIGNITQDSEWNVLETAGDWTSIQFKGQTGWVASWLVSSTTASPDQKTSQVKEVKARILNVRDFPGTENRIISQLPSGTIVEEVRQEKNWSFIRYQNGQTGWVDSTYLQETDKQEESEFLTILYQATNLRSGPGLNYEVIKQAPAKARYKIAAKEGKWFRILLDDGRSAYVADWVVSTASKLSTSPVLKSGKTVVLDAGHGGYDSGALGITTLEKILTLKTTTTIAEKLKNAGVQVILTRDDDTFVSLSERTLLSDRYKADAFVSIHFDSTVDPTANGATTYYYGENDMSLASAIHAKIGDDTTLRDRGIRYGNYYVLRNNKQPSVLLELGFLSNPWEEQLVNRLDYQSKVTTEISNGILTFLQ